jgi:GNAT superfamily N-acetyltransferase
LTIEKAVCKKVAAPPAAPEPVERSLAERLEQAYEEVPVPGLILHLADYSDSEVELVNFEAKQKNRGCGTAGMERLVSLADNLGIDLMLIVGGEPGAWKHDRLVDFYQRFGFEISSCEDILRRSARCSR